MGANNDTLKFRPRTGSAPASDDAAATPRRSGSVPLVSDDGTLRGTDRLLASRPNGPVVRDRPAASERASSSAGRATAGRASTTGRASASGGRAAAGNRAAASRASGGRQSMRGEADVARERARVRRAERAAGKDSRRILGGRVKLPEVDLSKVKLPSRPVLIGMGVVLALLLAFYGPVRDLYVARRTNEIYSAQLAALTESNSQLEADVDRLQTREGVEAEARERAYIVEGEDPTTAAQTDDSNKGEADVDASKPTTEKVQTNDAWYVHVLDFLFMYDPVAQGVTSTGVN